MRWQESSSSSAPPLSVSEPYLPVEEVARRLDLPLAILLRRVEAGDVPARRIEGPEGVRYSLRLSDLGIEPDRAPGEPVLDLVPAEDEAPAFAEATAPAEPVHEPVHEAVEEPAVARRALRIEPANGEHHAEPAAEANLDVVGVAAPGAWPDKVVPPPAEELAAELAAEHHHIHTGRQPLPARAAAGESSVDSAVPPPPSRDARLAVLTHAVNEPQRDVAAMTLDPRELVAGLLDRWERTLESRIYAEQRARFEAELNARQNLVKQLQLELQTARAEHAAVQAERDRRLAERERQIADLQRDLNEVRAAARRRHWLFGK